MKLIMFYHRTNNRYLRINEDLRHQIQLVKKMVQTLNVALFTVDSALNFLKKEENHRIVKNIHNLS